MHKLLVVSALIWTVLLAGQSAQSVTVYTIETSSDYHSAACSLRKSFRSTAINLAQAEARNLTPCQLCRPHERDAGVFAVLQQRRAAAEAAEAEMQAEMQKEKDAVSETRRREFAARTEKDGTVYRMRGSTSYHLASCELASRFPLQPTTYADARDEGLTSCTLCKPDAHPVVKSVIENTSMSHVYYVATVAAVVRKEPIATSPVLGRLSPLDWRSIYEMTPGWVRIQVGKAENPKGWVRATEDNLAPGTAFDAAYGIVKMEDKRWPVATKAAILRRVAKIGFTREQVTLALGAPSTKASEETAAGVTEVWVFPDRVITFKGGVVSSIKTVQATSNAMTSSSGSPTSLPTVPSTQSAPESSLTPGQRNAARSAQNYLNVSGFSRQGLIGQLSSEYGDKFSVGDATVAVDSLNIDWNAQAARSAAQYLKISGFSCQGLIQQLSSEHGDKYTVKQATYGAGQAGIC